MYYNNDKFTASYICSTAEQVLLVSVPNSSHIKEAHILYLWNSSTLVTPFLLCVYNNIIVMGILNQPFPVVRSVRPMSLYLHPGISYD